MNNWLSDILNKFNPVQFDLLNKICEGVKKYLTLGHEACGLRQIFAFILLGFVHGFFQKKKI